MLIILALVSGTPLAHLRAQESPSTVQPSIANPSANPESAVNQDQPAAPTTNGESKSNNASMIELRNKVTELQQRLKAIEEPGPLGMALSLWLAGGSGLITLLLALLAFRRLYKYRNNIQQLSGSYQILLTRVGGLEVQMEQERAMNWRQTIAASTPNPAPPQPQPFQAIAPPAPQTNPEIDQAVVGPTPVSKADLIKALNVANRQPLREAATAELNINSDSENALAMGRAIATELEEVPGGGSYWLISLQGQNWLFPTDRTLKGFASAQPAKGLFYYEQQIVARPQLIEPALLEQCGAGWSVKTMGRIATP